MGIIDVKRDGSHIVITEDGWLRLGVGNFANSVLATKVIVDGGTNAVQATINGGTPISTNIDASVVASGNLTANVGGTETPIKIAPLKFELGRMQIKPDLVIKFSLFGIPIGAIRIAGTTDFDPEPE